MLAKIDNNFIYKAHYSLSAVEQKIILYLASRLDPKNEKDFVSHVVPIKDFEKILWKNTKKVGNMYEYLKDISSSLLKKQIFFPKGTLIGERKILSGGINWFQSIFVTEDKNGAVSIEFMFSEQMKPFLLQLNRYANIDVLEAMELNSKHSIRMYKVFKAERERTKAFKQVSVLSYGLAELKALLMIGGKYEVLKNFRRRVLEPIRDEINENSNEISVSFEYLKTRRKVTGIEFSIYDKINIDPPKKLTKNEKTDYIPTVQDLEELSWSQRNAYDLLTKFGVKEGIALKQIVNKVKGGDMEGFEDLFIQKSLEHFKKWAKQQKTAKQSAGTFVNWWTKNGVFAHDNDVFWKLAEQVNVEKKKMGQEKLDNRTLAKDMSKDEFLTWYRENNKEAETEQAEN